MKRFITITTMAILSVVALSSTPANAQRGWDNNYRSGGSINATQAQLQARINNGISSGRLTQGEASRLQSKLNRIGALEARLRANDGRLSFRERQRLNSDLNMLAADITRQLNDFDTRFAHRHGGGWRNRNY